MDDLSKSDRDAAVRLAVKLHAQVVEHLGVELTVAAGVMLEKRFVEALVDPMCNVFRYARMEKRKWAA